MINLVGDFLVELGIFLWISLCFLIRGCMGHRVRVLWGLGISLWSQGFLCGS